jgi:hypothetical protein
MTRWRRAAEAVAMPPMLVVLLALVALPAAADPVDTGVWQSQRGDYAAREAPREARELRFSGESSAPPAAPARRDPALAGGVRSSAYSSYSADAPEASRPLRFSSEERRQLRRDLHDAGRDLYSPHR